MSESAFFFQGDQLLLPVDFSDTHTDIPFELAKDFDNPDIFNEGLPVVSILPETVLPENWKAIPVRQIMTMMSVKGSCPGRILRACHIAQWRRDSCFCGRCGAKNQDVPAAPGNTHRRCTECGKTEFPRICPAVIVVITDDENRILLAHNKRFKTGVYSHISGFNEAGETLEETVVREIREEVNIKVCDIVYVKSQPWPFPNSLMVGFKARYSSGTIQPDGDEIEDAKWFTKDNLLRQPRQPELPGEGSLSRFLINHWLNDTL